MDNLNLKKIYPAKILDKMKSDCFWSNGANVQKTDQEDGLIRNFSTKTRKTLSAFFLNFHKYYMHADIFAVESLVLVGLIKNSS